MRGERGERGAREERGERGTERQERRERTEPSEDEEDREDRKERKRRERREGREVEDKIVDRRSHRTPPFPTRSAIACTQGIASCLRTAASQSFAKTRSRPW